MSALRTALAGGALRRLLLGFAASSLGLWAFAILFALYAYAEGGATAVGLAVLVRMAPCVLAAPSLSVLADRHPRRTVLLASAWAQAVAVAVVGAAVALDVPFAVALGLAALLTAAGTPYKPAQGALIPQVADTPAQIAAANVAVGGVDYAGFLAGSLLTGAVATTAGVEAGLLLCAVPYLGAVLALAGLPRDARPEPAVAGDAPGALADLLAGVRTIRASGELRLVNGVYGIAMLVQGAMDVLVVVAAIELLDLGASGAGWLNSAWGVGGLAGGLVALALLGRGRLASGVVLGCLLAGLSFAAVGAWAAPVAALVLFALLGVGVAVLESALLTLTQRLAPDDVLARVLGVQEALFVAGSAGGGLLAALAVAALGVSGALIATGLVLPVLVVVLWAPLGRLEAGAPVPERPFALLRGLAMFAPLPVATIENLAARAGARDVAAGVEIITQGDVGERFFVLDEGRVQVLVDGRPVRTSGPGDCLGEIALLREQPRTATVRAVTPVRLVSLERADFLAGVSAHPRSTATADRLVAERLGRPAAEG